MTTRAVSFVTGNAGALSAFADNGRGGARLGAFAITVGAEPKSVTSEAGSGTGAVFLCNGGANVGAGTGSLEANNGTEVVFRVSGFTAGAGVGSLETGSGTGVVFGISGGAADAGVGSLETGMDTGAVFLVSGADVGGGLGSFETGPGEAAGVSISDSSLGNAPVFLAAAAAAVLIESGKRPVTVGALRTTGGLSGASGSTTGCDGGFVPTFLTRRENFS
jgi:hypothetical protein